MAQRRRDEMKTWGGADRQEGRHTRSTSDAVIVCSFLSVCRRVCVCGVLCRGRVRPFVRGAASSGGGLEEALWMCRRFVELWRHSL
jgi:hypothetical protein